jgi:hypothetical protein
MNIDDPLLKGFEERFGVNSVVARINDKLDTLLPEEITHRSVPLLRRAKTLLRKLSQGDVLFACEGRGAA